LKYPWLLFDADDTLFDFPRAEANVVVGQEISNERARK